MFEKASRAKLRFPTSQGLLTVEDLWDLPLTSTRTANLDDLARELHTKVTAKEAISFVMKSKTEDSTQLAFELVKHIINIKMSEIAEASIARINKEKKQQLLSLIASKETEQLAGCSLDELKAMAESL